MVLTHVHCMYIQRFQIFHASKSLVHHMEGRVVDKRLFEDTFMYFKERPKRNGIIVEREKLLSPK